MASGRNLLFKYIKQELHKTVNPCVSLGSAVFHFDFFCFNFVKTSHLYWWELRPSFKSNSGPGLANSCVKPQCTHLWTHFLKSLWRISAWCLGHGEHSGKGAVLVTAVLSPVWGRITWELVRNSQTPTQFQTSWVVGPGCPALWYLFLTDMAENQPLYCITWFLTLDYSCLLISLSFTGM